MKKIFKKIFKHPIGIAVSSGVISSTISALIVAYIKSESFMSASITVWKWVISLFHSVLTFGVPVWMLLLILIIYFKLINPISNSFNKNSSPDFLNYKSDIIEGIRWEWEWFSYYGKYSISNRIDAVCIHCNGYLIDNRHSYNINTLECEHCGFKKNLSEWEHEEYRNKIKREILRRTRNKSNENSM